MNPLRDSRSVAKQFCCNATLSKGTRTVLIFFASFVPGTGTWYLVPGTVLVTLSTGSTVTVLVTLSTGYCTCHVEYGYRTCSVQSSHHDPYLIKYSAAVFSGRFAKNGRYRSRQKRDMSWPRAWRCTLPRWDANFLRSGAARGAKDFRT